ncbi:hypothetical protein V1478_005168 [Vespula squamosa]|uniref:Uncharacterized protein n=1 Tax=Vespula squamosa TaxID=30214 RepID=A0ABD2BDL3_VESSQ
MKCTKKQETSITLEDKDYQLKVENSNRAIDRTNKLLRDNENKDEWRQLRERKSKFEIEDKPTAINMPDTYESTVAERIGKMSIPEI